MGRHDGNPETHSFVTSPEVVAAFAYSGDLGFNPITDSLPTPSGKPFQFSSPFGEELPASFASGDTHYQAPLEDGSAVEVAVSPSSDRLQLLEPFPAWEQGNAEDMTVLAKIKGKHHPAANPLPRTPLTHGTTGKCTTDHISPAGPWYNYRGHLENISNNLLTAATNGFIPDASLARGNAVSQLDGTTAAIPQVAKSYKEAGIRWCIVGDSNYGEGSSREHAALEPRFLGGVAVIARSFARIHETNLKKQGMLALTFADAGAYDEVGPSDRLSVLGVEEIAPGRQLLLRVRRADGGVWETWLNHSYQEGQIAWLRFGSALNFIKSCRD